MICSINSEGLVTNYGEGVLQNGRGHIKFIPQKRGAENILAMQKGGTTVLPCIEGGWQTLSLLKCSHTTILHGE